MDSWELWKKGFEAWENATAQFLEQWLKSPLVLEPSGAVLTQVLKAKTFGDKLAASFWGAMGLPTKRDQERALHALNQLESKLLDLEERLDALDRDQGASSQLGAAPVTGVASSSTSYSSVAAPAERRPRRHSGEP